MHLPFCLALGLVLRDTSEGAGEVRRLTKILSPNHRTTEGICFSYTLLALQKMLREVPQKGMVYIRSLGLYKESVLEEMSKALFPLPLSFMYVGASPACVSV